MTFPSIKSAGFRLDDSLVQSVRLLCVSAIRTIGVHTESRVNDGHATQSNCAEVFIDSGNEEKKRGGGGGRNFELQMKHGAADPNIQP